MQKINGAMRAWLVASLEVLESTGVLQSLGSEFQIVTPLYEKLFNQISFSVQVEVVIIS